MPAHAPTPAAHTSGLDALAVSTLIDLHFPQVYEGQSGLQIESVTSRSARVRMTHDASMIRPGGTISGPTMFKLADFAIYVAVLGAYGDGAIQAVTTTLTINFLSRPSPSDLVGDVTLIKCGRRLAVAQVEIYSAGLDAMVAHATGTYAIPAGAVLL